MLVASFALSNFKLGVASERRHNPSSQLKQL